MRLRWPHCGCRARKPVPSGASAPWLDGQAFDASARATRQIAGRSSRGLLKGIRMPKTFTKADAEVVEVMNDALRQYHTDLVEAGLRIGVVMVRPATDEVGVPTGPALRFGGAAATACIKKVSPKDRVLKPYDAEIQIDEMRWDDMTDQQRLAVMDHELQHIELQYDDGVLRTDDDGRPVLKMRPDDWVLTGFEAVVRRHGEAALECPAAKTTWTRCEQALFDFDGASRKRPAREAKTVAV